MNDQETPLVTVQPPDEKQPETIVDKLKDFAPKKTRKPRTKRVSTGKQIGDNLLIKLAPTLIASFTAVYIRQLIQEPYKLCAPSEEEVLSIIRPLFAILNRYVEITGQASENVIDLITAAIAATIFGTRAFVTYATIKEQEKNGDKTQASDRNNDTGARNSVTDHRLPISNGSERTSTTANVPYDSGPNKEDTTGEAALFSELFAKDIDGRVRLGMLPPRIQKEND